MSKGLEALDGLRFDVSMSQDINYKEANNECNIIEKELKVLEIIKKKFCFIDKINPKFWTDKSVYNEICTYDYYKFLVDKNEFVIKEGYQLTQEEFDLLKEVLGNE